MIEILSFSTNCTDTTSRAATGTRKITTTILHFYTGEFTYFTQSVLGLSIYQGTLVATKVQRLSS